MEVTVVVQDSASDQGISVFSQTDCTDLVIIPELAQLSVLQGTVETKFDYDLVSSVTVTDYRERKSLPRRILGI